jgi:glucokinase
MTGSSSLYPKLVADLGGTNIRFAICHGLGDASHEEIILHDIQQFSLRDYQGLKHLITYYLSQCSAVDGIEQIQSCCFAVAGPMLDGVVKMTNYSWEISAEKLNEILGITNAAIINDFAAIAYSVPFLTSEQLLSIGGGESDPLSPISVFGPGTGLGAALLIPDGEHSGYQVIPTEGGHAALSARSELELEAFEYWRNKGCRINREFFICGNGIERLFEAIIAKQRGVDSVDEIDILSAPEIQQRACGDGDSKLDQSCRMALEAFCTLLGSAAGDQALCTGARGGLILAGGILPKLVDFLVASNFRRRFESKGPMSNYNQSISTQLILAEQPGLIGAAAYQTS